jgi:glycosyltransferase involved in cell wall biosynthesis
MNVAMIPSVSGGLGHLGRTATLARMIQKIDPAVNIEYLIDTGKLRLFNIDSALSIGIKVSLLPALTRDNREAFVRACLRDVDVIVDDTSSYLLPLRLIAPKAAWISIPMYPLGDELFMGWPYLAQNDRIIWAYPPVLDFPPELELLARKVVKTGPFLELEGVPERETARAKLGFAQHEHVVLYSPRGMPFGRDFGERVLSGVFGAVTALRGRYPSLRLVLAAVRDPEELRTPGVPYELPDYVSVLGVLSPAEMLLYLRACDIALTEGSNMTQEAAALGTPIVIVPGTIYETWLLGTRLLEHGAARVIWIERVTPDTLAEAFQYVLDDRDGRRRMTERARKLVMGGGGVAEAARLVLEFGARQLRGEPEFRMACHAP